MAESPWGGSEELWSQMAAAALQEGHEVMALVPAWNPRFYKVQALVDKGMQVAGWAEFNNTQESNARTERPVWYPYHSLLEFRPDIVCVSHGGLLDSVNGHTLLVEMLLRHNIRFVVIVQVNTDLYFPNDTQRRILQQYLSRAETAFFVSRQNLEIARKQLAMPLENAVLINNPVNLTEYDAVPWPWSNTALMASVARFDTWAKGQDLLFEVLGQNEWRERDWKLRLYGKGIHETYFRELVRYYQIEDKVEIPGENRDVRQIWAEHQLLVLPSRLEGAPLALFEAMLCGRPAVVTDVGGNADWVQDGESGFVAKAACVSLVDDAMERAWANRHLWPLMGQRARAYLVQHHEIHSGKTLLAHLKESLRASESPDRYLVPEKIELPPISVIIPCYNYARYLPEAVESVIAQTYQDFEIIIVNDGSTDNTRQIAEALIMKYPAHRIRLINQENSGQPAISRNRGISAANGKYVLPLDADDMIAPTMLEECLKLLVSRPEIAIAYTDRLDFDGVVGVVQAGEYDLSRLIHSNHISYCALYRREVWEKVGGYRDNVKALEDWDFWIAAGAIGYYGKRIPLPLFKYRRHDTGIFQEALKNFDKKQAQIIMNNAAVYDPLLVAKAKDVLGSLSAAPTVLVSVIVPTHNRRGMLPDAIRSILAQTYTDFEIIVVNDAGEDVADIVNDLNSRGNIRHIRHDTNKGLAAARNTGIRAARGKYIAYLDDDDLFYPSHVETLVRFLESGEYKVAYTDACRAHQHKHNGEYEVTKRDVLYSFDFDYDVILTANFLPVLCIMHERLCVDQTGFFDESLKNLEDWDMWIRMSREFKFAHIKKPTCEFSWRTDGTTMTSAPVNGYAETRLRIIAKYAAISKNNAVDIVIPVHGSCALTRRCVESVLVTAPQAHIIVVDDASPQAEMQALLAGLEKHSQVKVVRLARNGGFIAACHAGAAAGSGEFILFLNSDVEAAAAGWLEALIPTDLEVAITGARLLYPPDKPGGLAGAIQHAGVARNADGLPHHPLGGSPGNHSLAVRAHDVNAVTGACLLIRRAVWDALGGFDRIFGRGIFEDVDLCWRARKRGWRVRYEPAATLYHHEHGSLSEGRTLAESGSADNWIMLLARWGRLPSDEALFYPDKPALLAALKQHAMRLASSGDAHGAERAFVQALEQAPGDVDTLVSLGKLCYDARRYQEAASYLDRAAAINPADSDVRSGLQKVHERLSEQPAARVELDLPTRLRKMTGRTLPVPRQEIAAAATLLGAILQSEDPLAAVAGQFDRVYGVVMALLLLNRDQASADGNRDLAEALDGLYQHVLRLLPGAQAADTPGAARLAEYLRNLSGRVTPLLTAEVEAATRLLTDALNSGDPRSLLRERRGEVTSVFLALVQANRDQAAEDGRPDLRDALNGLYLCAAAVAAGEAGVPSDETAVAADVPTHGPV